MHSLFDFFSGDYIKGIDNTLGNLRIINILQTSIGLLLFVFLALGSLWVFIEWFDIPGLKKLSQLSTSWRDLAKKFGVAICLLYGCTTFLFIYIVNILSAIRAELSLRINSSEFSQGKLDEFSQLNSMSSIIEDKFQQSNQILKFLFGTVSFGIGIVLLFSF